MTPCQSSHTRQVIILANVFLAIEVQFAKLTHYIRYIDVSVVIYVEIAVWHIASAVGQATVSTCLLNCQLMCVKNTLVTVSLKTKF